MSNAARSNQESSSDDRRFLHYTMKITNRLETKNFFCNILGMKVLRHEEMGSGCAAQCNGDYQSPWSKTMAGYGQENSFFAFELNFNYDVEGYEYGNDFSSITIYRKEAVANARQFLDKKYVEADEKQSIIVRSPDNHRFILVDEDVPPGDDPVRVLSLNVSNLKKSVDYYQRLLQMKVNQNESSDKQVRLYYGLTNPHGSQVKTQSGFLVDRQCQLELIGIDQPIRRGTGYGRKAFSCPVNDIDSIQKMMEKEGYTVLIPAMELGGMLDLNKVKVVILQDPDGNEICFVGEENYFKACESVPDAEKKFYEGLKNQPDEPNKYLIGEDESTKRQNN